MIDLTENIRRSMLATCQPAKDLEEAGDRWDTAALQRDFIVHAFLAPFVTVTRKSDGARGSLEFTHSPRWYFNFRED